MTCEACNGTRLTLHTDYTNTHGVTMRFYRDEECNACGGKGYIREGEKEYTVALYVDESRAHQFFVIARNASEALFLSAEMFVSTGAMIRPGEEVALTVEEH